MSSETSSSGDGRTVCALKSKEPTTKSQNFTSKWAIIGISLLISLQLTYAEQSDSLREVDDNRTNFNETSNDIPSMVCKKSSPVSILLRTDSSQSGKIGKTSSEECLLRPTCDESRGCSSPLYCHNFSQNASSEFSEPHVIVVTPHNLERIVEDTSRQNVCAIVLFYAPWCTFSVQFARKFNALGKSFKGLPILALNLADSEQYKYILAYLPLVAFYYQGKTLFKFSLDSSFEDLKTTIANITGFQPVPVDLSDSENNGPVKTERENSDRVFLVVSVWWVAFVGLVYAMKSRQLRDWCLRTTHRLSGRGANVQQ